MLDPWIIDQIRRREEDERHRREEQPSADMPEYPDPPADRDGYGEQRDTPDGERGVVIIDFSI